MYARRIGHTTLPSGVFRTCEPYTSSGAPLFRQKTQIFGSCLLRAAGFLIFLSTPNRSNPAKPPPMPISRSWEEDSSPPVPWFWKGLRMEKRSFRSRMEVGGGQQQESRCPPLSPSPPAAITHGHGGLSSKPRVAFRDSVMELGLWGTLCLLFLVTSVERPR